MADLAAGMRRWRGMFANPEYRRWVWNYWVLDPLDGAKNTALHYVGRAMPIDACSALGGFFGGIAMRFSKRYAPQRERVKRNWALLRRDGSDPDKPHAVRDSAWDNVGRVAMEYSVLDRLWAAGRIDVAGAEHVAAAWATGRPVIVMSVHLGGWESIAPALIAQGHKVTMICQPIGHRFGTRLLFKSRERCGTIVVPPWRAGALPAVRALKSRKSVLLIHIDEYVNGRVFAPSFGRPPRIEGNIANTARMAALCDAVVIPVHALRTRGARFRVEFSPPLDLVKTADPEADLAANVAMIDGLIEPLVRDNLEQWHMLFDFRPDR